MTGAGGRTVSQEVMGVADVRESGGRREAPGAVVVGVDGSQGSARALAWALREAHERQAAVRVVTVWAWGGAGSARQARQNQEALVRAVAARFPGALPHVDSELVEGDAATVLMEHSHHGDLLVLGSRGLGELDGVAVGSVADACLHHASCPVVVVPATPSLGLGTAEALPDGRRAGLAPALLGAVGLL